MIISLCFYWKIGFKIVIKPNWKTFILLIRTSVRYTMDRLDFAASLSI